MLTFRNVFEKKVKHINKIYFDNDIDVELLNFYVEKFEEGYSEKDVIELMFHKNTVINALTKKKHGLTKKQLIKLENKRLNFELGDVKTLQFPLIKQIDIEDVLSTESQEEEIILPTIITKLPLLAIPLCVILIDDESYEQEQLMNIIDMLRMNEIHDISLITSRSCDNRNVKYYNVSSKSTRTFYLTLLKSLYCMKYKHVYIGNLKTLIANDTILCNFKNVYENILKDTFEYASYIYWSCLPNCHYNETNIYDNTLLKTICLNGYCNDVPNISSQIFRNAIVKSVLLEVLMKSTQTSLDDLSYMLMMRHLMNDKYLIYIKVDKCENNYELEKYDSDYENVMYELQHDVVPIIRFDKPKKSCFDFTYYIELTMTNKMGIYDCLKIIGETFMFDKEIIINDIIFSKSMLNENIYLFIDNVIIDDIYFYDYFMMVEHVINREFDKILMDDKYSSRIKTFILKYIRDVKTF